MRATPVFSLKRTSAYPWILFKEDPREIIFLIDQLYRIIGIGLFPKQMTRGACRVFRIDLMNNINLCVQDAYLALHPRTKKAMDADWPNMGKSKKEVLPMGGNIGLLLGAKSGIIDVDLDCREAKGLADLLLPTPFVEFDRGTSNRCCETNANSSLFDQSSGSSILQEDHATRLERRCGFA